MCVRGEWMATSRTEERLRRRTARIGVIGLGYVGLPLAVEFAKAGFEVTGFDVDVAKVDAINKGQSYIGEDKVGGVIWQDAGQRHELRNLTDAPYQNILVEMKQKP